MSKGIRVEEAASVYGEDTLESRAREWIRGFIEGLLEEELTLALGVKRSGRVGDARRGYRHGVRPRTVTTSLGPTSFSMPRARVFEGEAAKEWSSEVLPRYQRRTRRVDEAILGVYLSGANTRRIKGALSPLLRGAPLSKDAVSRLVGRLSEDFEAWRRRDLSGEKVVYLFLDGWYPRVRLGKRRARVPVLVTMGVRQDGSRVVLDFRLAGQESVAGWREAIVNLSERGHRGAEAGRHRRQRGSGEGAWGGLAEDRHSALHGPQAAQPGGESSRPDARGTSRRLPAYDLRRDGRGRRAGTRPVH